MRSKDGQVIYVQPGFEPEWTGGTIQKTDHSIIVNNMFGTQTYTLLDHITVSQEIQRFLYKSELLSLKYFVFKVRAYQMGPMYVYSS